MGSVQHHKLKKIKRYKNKRAPDIFWGLTVDIYNKLCIYIALKNYGFSLLYEKLHTLVSWVELKRTSQDNRF